MKIKKTKSGSYTCRVFLGTDPTGKKHYKRITAATIQDVKAQSSTIQRYPYQSAPKSLSYILEQYISQREALLSPSTIRGYHNILNGMRQNVPSVLIQNQTNLNKGHIQDMIYTLTGKVSVKTIRNYVGLISAALNSSGINLDLKGLQFPREPKKEIRVPSDREVKRLLTAAQKRDPEMYLVILCASLAPMRRGEICAVGPEDVDEKKGVIHIRGDVVYDRSGVLVSKSTAKTADSEREILLPPEVISLIKAKGCITTYSPRQVSRHFARLVTVSRTPHMRFHDLRHYACSRLIAAGASEAYVLRQGGWSTTRPELMRAVYRHMTDDDRIGGSFVQNEIFEDLRRNSD